VTDDFIFQLLQNQSEGSHYCARQRSQENHKVEGGNTLSSTESTQHNKKENQVM
jgi:hypothetical protein